MRQTTETWKSVKDFPNYEVSSLGNVRNSTTGKALKPYPNGGGYLKVKLSKDNKRTQCYVHRIVAEAFIDNPHNLPTVNHRSGIRDDNQKINLEWADYKMQQSDIQFRKFFTYEEPEPAPKLSRVDILFSMYFSHE